MTQSSHALLSCPQLLWDDVYEGEEANASHEEADEQQAEPKQEPEPVKEEVVSVVPVVKEKEPGAQSSGDPTCQAHISPGPIHMAHVCLALAHLALHLPPFLTLMQL